MFTTKRRLLALLAIAALALSSVAATYVPPPQPVTTTTTARLSPSSVTTTTLSGVVVWADAAAHSFGLSSKGVTYTVEWDKTTHCVVQSQQANPLPGDNCALIVRGDAATVTGVMKSSNTLAAMFVQAAVNQTYDTSH